MHRFSKAAQTAITVASLLAERYGGGEGCPGPGCLSSADVAKNRNLSRPLVAKILSTLSAQGVVNASPGPGGGYALARPPAEVSLAEVVTPFINNEKQLVCPFGPGWCGVGQPCPIHDDLIGFTDKWDDYLTNTKLDRFVR